MGYYTSNLYEVMFSHPKFVPYRTDFDWFEIDVNIDRAYKMSYWFANNENIQDYWSYFRCKNHASYIKFMFRSELDMISFKLNI